MIGKEIAIAGVLAGRPEKILNLAEKAKKDGADVLEFRFDRIQVDTDEAVQLLKAIKKLGLCIVGTKRPVLKGEDRGDFFSAIIPFVDAIDLEVEEEIESIVKLAKAKEKKVIISYHNYEETPKSETLKKILDSMRKKGADIAKIATFIKSREGLVRLLLLTSNYKALPIITIGMGDIGRISRIIAPIFGSCLTYGYINKPQAPGQMKLSTLKKEIQRYVYNSG
ncbi:type I 3-dehydroquinate dehydratase [bacterium]|nr:type I 3-dehydroquinate dehydratase [bacterium]MBU2461961.1 type I 3-dehydroquinate dehydratase [bacterium]